MGTFLHDWRESRQQNGALVPRHIYILRGSCPRILELAYWPLMQMFVWGYITLFLRENSSWVARAAGVLISGVLLWDVLFRANLGFAISFLEEMWSRNFGQLFISPLRPFELVAALMTMSAIRTALSVLSAALLSLPIFDVWVFGLGLPLIAFFANLLVMGWCVGMVVSAIVLRFGMGAEGFCWAAVFIFAPVGDVYYPIAVLPEWLQMISWCLPSAYVF
jgi:ABC-2 type transport system permease protein